MHLFTRNVNTAFREMLNVFMHREYNSHPGEETSPVSVHRRQSRNGPVLIIDEPVTVTYTHPRERVLFNAARDANPFFHLYEALWMLAGRNDVAPVAYYAKRMKEYSDDGKTLNGAYGYRWRHTHHIDMVYADGSRVDPTQHFIPEQVLLPDGRLCRMMKPGKHAIVYNDVDQLDTIVAHLKADPTSRRAVLQMWEVESDLLRIGPGSPSKDVCCLSWDTKFRSPEGDTNIQELAGRFQANPEYRFPVYSVDTDTGNQKLSWMTNAWKTGIRPVLKISFDDGSSVRTTGEHIFFKKTHSWTGGKGNRIRLIKECQASELCVGDRVVAEMPEHAVSRIRGGGYRVFRRNIYSGTEFSNLEYEHREYLDLVGILEEFDGGSGWLIHHKDEDKTNNRLSNLEQIRVGEHGAKHMMGSNNPWYKRSEESRKQQSERTRNRSKEVKDRLKNAGLAARKRMDRELSDELRKALYTKMSCRSEEQQRMVDEWRYIKKANHKIVSIEKVGNTAVFDFTVPGRHNAVLANGVVVHNCNLSVMFSLRESEYDPESTVSPNTAPHYGHRLLDMTVTNRSNDMIWGMLGANFVHFTILQEYMAARLGIEVGKYHHFTNNLHVYENNWKPEEWLKLPARNEMLEFGYDSYNWNLIPLVQDPATFERELPSLVGNGYGPGVIGTLGMTNFTEPFLQTVAKQAFCAFACYKDKQLSSALAWANRIAADDWRIACTEWLKRRKGS